MSADGFFVPPDQPDAPPAPVPVPHAVMRSSKGFAFMPDPPLPAGAMRAHNGAVFTPDAAPAPSDTSGWGNSPIPREAALGLAHGAVTGTANMVEAIPQAVRGALEGTEAPLRARANAPLSAQERQSIAAETGEAPDAWAMMQRNQAQQATQDIGATAATAAARAVGHAGEVVDRAIPQLSAQERQSIAAETGHMIGTFLPSLAVAAAGGGVPGLVAAQGLQTYQSTYAQARAQGMTPARAHAYAVPDALVNGAMMALPGAELLGKFAPPVRTAVGRWAAHLALSSGFMAGATAVSQAALNVIHGRPAGTGISPRDLLPSALGGAVLGGIPASRGAPQEGAEAPTQGVAAPAAVAAPARAEVAPSAPASAPAAISPAMPAGAAQDLLDKLGGLRSLDVATKAGAPMPGEQPQAAAPEAAPAAPAAAAAPAQPEPEQPPAPEAPAVAPEVPPETPKTGRLRTIEQIVAEDGVTPKKAAAIQAEEIAALPTARPITREEMGARLAGVGAAKATVAAAPEPIPEAAPVAAPEPQAAPTEEAPVKEDRAPKPQSMMAYLKAEGGIRDESGELAARDVRRWYPGFINNKTGLRFDYARERAEQQGFLPPNSDINDFLAAVDEHQSGRPVYRGADVAEQVAYESGRMADAERERHAAVRETVLGAAREYGVQLSDEQADTAAGWVMAHDVSPEEAVWSAVSLPSTEDMAAISSEAQDWPGFNEGKRPPLPPQSGPDLFGTARPGQQQRAPEPTVRTDPRQGSLLGTEGSAVQAQAARDQAGRGALLPGAAQRAADEGLFARPEPEQPALPTPAKIDGNLGEAFLRDAPPGPTWFRRAAEWVRQEGIKDGNERLVFLDARTGQPVLAHGGDQRDFAGVPPSFVPTLDDPAQHLVAIHNHPSGRSLSAQDLDMLDYPAIREVAAVGHDGSVYSARNAPGVRSTGIAHGLARAAFATSDLKNSLERSVKDGHVSLDAANKIVAESVMRALAEHGAIDYVSHLPPESASHVPSFLGQNPVSGHTLANGRDEAIDLVHQRNAPVPLSGGPEGARGDQGGAELPAPSKVVGPGGGTGGGAGFRETPPDLTAKPIQTHDDLTDRLNRVPVIGGFLHQAARTLADPESNSAQIVDLIGKGWEEVKKGVAPMAAGARLGDVEVQARAQAKHYQNSVEYIRRTARDGADFMRKNFSRDERMRVFNAVEAEHQAELNGVPAEPEAGVASLTDKERGLAMSLVGMSRATAREAQALGMLPPHVTSWYTPHDLVGLRPGEKGPVRVVRDAGVMVLKTMQLQEAIAGRHLINEIEQTGRRIGVSLVREVGSRFALTPEDEDIPNQRGGGPRNPLNPFGQELRTSTPNLAKRKYATIEQTEAAGRRIPLRDDGRWFTIPENWAFYRSVYDGTGEDGKARFRSQPLEVHPGYAGPLHSILWHNSSIIARGLLDLKRRSMTAIMWGIAHLGVVASRAVAVSPRIIAMMRQGHTGAADAGALRQAYMDGLRPAGHRPGKMGVSSWEEPQLEAGRSWTAKGLGAMAGVAGGDRARTAVRAGVDWAGDQVHGRMWDSIAALQMGIYMREREAGIAKGLPPEVAGPTAAHAANLFAGVIPKEAMSQAATTWGNLLMFSRTYRLASSGIVKRAVMGLPRDVQAQIYRDPGTRGYLDAANSLARRHATSALAREVGYYVVGSSLLQSAAALLTGNGDDPNATLWGRMATEARHFAQNPASLDPISLAEAMWHATPMAGNEPGKRDRILLGHDARGTGLYLRTPFGKTVADTLGTVVGLATDPLATLNSMASGYMHLASAVLSHYDDFGRAMRDPTAGMGEQAAETVTGIARGVVRAFMPSTTIQAAFDLASGGPEGAKRDVAVMLGQGLGLSLSRGYPGGPMRGEVARAQAHHRFVASQDRPEIAAMVQKGNLQGAVAAMVKDGATPLGAMQSVQRMAHPRPLTPAQVRAAMRYGSPDQRAEIEEMLRTGGLGTGANSGALAP